MKRIKTKRCHRKIISSEILALKELRLSQSLTLKEVSKKLNLSPKSLGAIENGRVSLTNERIKEILASLGKSYQDFIFTKRVIQKERLKKKKRKTIKHVLKNQDRRSYQRLITKESRTLQALRKLKKITQDEASHLCGYPRSTIGHIENGRIELSKQKIEFIVSSYGSTMKEFTELLTSKKLITDIQDECIEIIKSFSGEKLEVIYNLLKGYQ